MWAFINGGDHYHYGEIKEATEEYLLIEMDNGDDIPSSLTLHSLIEVSDTHNVLFFETKDKLNIWLKWLETPQAAKHSDNIVNLRKDN